ncbi:phage tail tip lysozyme, partial [Acinetobacter baumannii]|nr:phage tail tip lysozyme [Acinetobacter baumannii]
QPVASRGYGLVQWTPWTKIIDWLKEKGYYPDVSNFGVGECERIQWEMENNQQWIATSAYPESFASFSKSTADPYTLAI